MSRAQTIFSSSSAVDMKTLAGSCFMAALLLAVFSSVQAQYAPTYVAVGGSLDLNPPEGKTDGLTSILWKFNGQLVAEWVDQKVPLEYYGKFKDRTKLDTTNGHLEITHMTVGDTGVYTVETNNRLQVGGYNVKVINKVPKPDVTTQPLPCSSESESCTLTCEGNTTGAEPLTYSWKGGDGDWKETGKTFTINNTEEIQSVNTFTCWMKNVINAEESEPIKNPLFKTLQGPPGFRHWSSIVRPILKSILVLLLTWAVVYLVWRKPEALCPCNKQSG